MKPATPAGYSHASGRVVRLWRYPVKSMLGEECDYISVNERGVDGDRAFAVRDINGNFGSGKNTRRFRKIDGLFAFRAAYDGDLPKITFPNGRSMLADDPEIHRALSATLGQPVTLARELTISHLDAAPVHLLTTASLAWLRTVLPDAQVDDRRFRPNVLIDVPGKTQIEQGWLAKTVCIGDQVRLRVSDFTERCVMVELAQSELPKDPRILKAITVAAESHFGVYAEVLTPGRIKCADRAVVVN
jgi:uncharacterized protein